MATFFRRAQKRAQENQIRYQNLHKVLFFVLIIFQGKFQH